MRNRRSEATSNLVKDLKTKYRSELKRLKEEHLKQSDKLQQEHESASQARGFIHDQAIEKVKSETAHRVAHDKNKEAESLTTKHKEDLKAVREMLENLERKQRSEIVRLQDDHEVILLGLKSDHSQEVGAWRSSYQRSIASVEFVEQQLRAHTSPPTHGPEYRPDDGLNQAQDAWKSYIRT